MAIIIAVWTKLFFKKFKFNIYEILTFLCFVMGIGMLFLSVFGIIQSLKSINLIVIACIVFLIYTSWAIGQFYEKGKIISYIKALFAYLLGTLTFYLTATQIGSIIDIVTKH